MCFVTQTPLDTHNNRYDSDGSMVLFAPATGRTRRSADQSLNAGPTKRTRRRGAFLEPQAARWCSRVTPISKSFDEFPFFAVTAALPHTNCRDVAPSNRNPDLSCFMPNEINALCERLVIELDRLNVIYAGLLNHLSMTANVTIETGSLLSSCFFLQHNLSGQFDMLGMNLCARHSREVEVKLAMFPPIHKLYPLCTSSTDAALWQMNELWTSPLLLHTFISTCQRHMAKQALPLPEFAAS